MSTGRLNTWEPRRWSTWKVFCLQNIFFHTRFFTEQLDSRKDAVSLLCAVGFYARPATTSEEQELFSRVVSVSPYPTKTGKGNTIEAKVAVVTVSAGNTVIATGQ